MQNKLIVFILIIALTLIVIPIINVQAQAMNTYFYGYVYNMGTAGKVSGASWTITYGGNVYTSGVTGSNGMFSCNIPTTWSGTFHINVHANGFQYDGDADINVNDVYNAASGYRRDCSLVPIVMPTPPPQQNNLLIFGYVTDSSTTNALSGVTVNLKYNNQIIDTDITDVGTGWYQLDAQNGWSGYIELDYDIVNYNGDTENIPIDIVYTSGSGYQKNIALTPSSPPITNNLVISGYVYDYSTLNSIPNAYVELGYNGNAITHTNTNSVGYYTINIQNGWSGSIQLTSYAIGYNSNSVNIPVNNIYTASEGYNRDIPLISLTNPTPNPTANPSVNPSINPNAAFYYYTGTVWDYNTGLTIPNAYIKISDDLSGENVIYSGFSNAYGFFNISGQLISDGGNYNTNTDYYCTIIKSGYVMFIPNTAKKFSLNEFNVSGNNYVKNWNNYYLTSIENPSINPSVNPTTNPVPQGYYAISGYVRNIQNGNGISNIPIYLYSPNGIISIPAVTDNNGYYVYTQSISTALTGNYWLRVGSNAIYTNNSVADVLYKIPESFNSQSNSIQVNFNLSPNGYAQYSIYGMTYNALYTSHRIGNVLINITKENNEIVSTYSDNSGSYTLYLPNGVLDSGIYTVNAYVQGYEQYLGTFTYPDFFVQRGNNVNINIGLYPSVTSNTVSIQTIVYDKNNGIPLNNAVVELYYYSNKSPVKLPIYTDTQGNAVYTDLALLYPNDQYVLQVEANGYYVSTFLLSNITTYGTYSYNIPMVLKTHISVTPYPTTNIPTITPNPTPNNNDNNGLDNILLWIFGRFGITDVNAINLIWGIIVIGIIALVFGYVSAQIAPNNNSLTLLFGFIGVVMGLIVVCVLNIWPWYILVPLIIIPIFFYTVYRFIITRQDNND